MGVRHCQRKLIARTPTPGRFEVELGGKATMAPLNPFNQFSFLLIAGGALLALAALLAVSGLNRR